MEKQEQIIEDRLQKLIKKMKELNYESFKIERIRKQVNELRRKGVRGVDRFVQKLLNRADNEEGYRDIEKEGRFAIILARNGFSGVTFIKEDIEHKSPDLKATWNKNTVYFEVTRKRPVEDELAKEQEDTKFPSSDPEDIYSRILGKIGQLMDGKINILVFWSGTVAVDKFKMKEAFEYIQQEIEQDARVYQKLSGILFFGEGGLSVPTMKQCYLFKNEKALKPIDPRLTKKLDSLNELSPKRLKIERERWTAILKGKRN